MSIDKAKTGEEDVERETNRESGAVVPATRTTKNPCSTNFVTTRLQSSLTRRIEKSGGGRGFRFSQECIGPAELHDGETGIIRLTTSFEDD